MRHQLLALLVLAPAQASAADLLDAAAASGEFDRFLSIVERAGVTAELTDAGPYTVFMPTDAAFDRLPPATLESFGGASTDALRAIVLQHVIKGVELPSDDIPRALETANGGALRVTWEQGDLTLYSDPRPVAGEAASVVWGDLEADNGIVHAVDAVMLPMAALDVNPPVQSVANPDGMEPAGRQVAERPEVEPDVTVVEPEAAAEPEAASGEPEAASIEPEVTYVEPDAIEPNVTYVDPEPEPEAVEPDAIEPDVTYVEPEPVEPEPADAEAPPEPETEFLTELPEREAAGDAAQEAGAGEQVSALSALTAADMKDMTVVSRDEEKEGAVEYVVLSSETGDIDLLLARFDDYLGLFGKLVAIPWEDVEVARGEPLLIADMSADDIDNAEEADLDQYTIAE